MPIGSHSLLWLVTRKLLLELPHQGRRLLLLLGLLQALPGEQRLLGLHRLETKGLTLGLWGLLGLGGLLHLERKRIRHLERVIYSNPLPLYTFYLITLLQ